MAKVANLNAFRKQKIRAERRARADTNAVKFGRSKAERALEKARAAQAAAALDSHQREE